MAAELRLKTYRLSPRKSTVWVDSNSAALYLPTYFGRRRWAVPLGELGVLDLTVEQWDAGEEDVLFASGLLVPYFFTTGPATTPTTALLFKQPQRVPPIRALAAWAPNTDVPVGVLESRSGHGADLDGVLLRFEEPAEARDVLVGWGAEPVVDELAWLKRHRRTVEDPDERAKLRRRDRNITWLGRSSTLLIALALLAGFVSGDDPSLVADGAILALVISSFVVRSVAFRMSKADRYRLR